MITLTREVRDDQLLQRIMSFRHPELVTRLEKKLTISRSDAEELFNDMKRFLFEAGTTSERLVPPQRIDEAWHHFIVFTKDYDRFCREHFGKFIHHNPRNSAHGGPSCDCNCDS